MKREIIYQPVNTIDPAALYCRYPGQSGRQGCYLQIQCGGDPVVVSCDYDSEIGPAVPESVYFGRTVRVPIPCLTADAANRLLAGVRPLVERVVAGYSEMTGHSYTTRGALDDDAQSACDQIERLAEVVADDGGAVVVWDAAAWLCGAGDHGITAETTDAEIARIAERIVADASREGCHVIDGLDDYLRELRDELAESAE